MLNPALTSPAATLPPPFHTPLEAAPDHAAPSNPALVPPGTPGRRLKHGLYSQQAVAPGEDAAEFDAMLEEFLESEGATDPADRMLVERAVRAQWHSLRVWGLESGVYERLDNDPELREHKLLPYLL